MIGPERVRRVAAETGFRAEAVEKVLYLTAILDRLRTHPELRGAWVLKGGTAINLYYLEVPRLSVDMDINYIGSRELETMRAARPAFERAVIACCEREGCQVRRVPGEHAGGKYRLRYAGGIGGPGNLELDVNFVQRVPLFDIDYRVPGFPSGGPASRVPVLAVEELAAGKFTALLTRTAPRDAFDAWQLLESVPDLLRRPGLRTAFVVQAAAVRQDLRTKDPSAVRVTARAVRDELLPLLRIEARPFDGDPNEMSEHLNVVCTNLAKRLLRWRQGERAFLDRILEMGEIVPGLLTDDPDLQDRIAGQPMLRWKAMHVRQYRRLPAGEPEEA
ncbi:MAG: nucleotidyl transferase AbiEii/AbiGii toxin family protein [candidate division NC10 bacterium]|nr:nucleotidyl transferase AbiEii/AbiGii toxin family protein [candidate division NC10 bacterium]